MLSIWYDIIVPEAFAMFHCNYVTVWLWCHTKPWLNKRKIKMQTKWKENKKEKNKMKSNIYNSNNNDITVV